MLFWLALLLFFLFFGFIAATLGVDVANNGFTGQYSASCVSIDDYARAYCAATPGGYSQYAGTTFWAAGGYEVWCYTPGVQTSRYVRVGYPTCEIPGPPLTEQEQVSAISDLFPLAVAILATAWGLRFVRKILERALFSRHGGDE